MNDIDVSIILVNYNTKELTTNAIESIFNKTIGVKYEVIIVDNNSSDDSIIYFKEKFGSKIIVIELLDNIGFGKANNIAIKKSKGEFVFLLNTDTILINNAIHILFNFMINNKDCAVCGGNLLDKQGRPIHSYLSKLPNIKTIIFDPIIYILNNIRKEKKVINYNYSNENIKVGYITGADMMVRKNVLDEVGEFDSDFFMYFEESELQNRILKKDYTIYSVPKAKIVHLVGMSSSSNTDFENQYKKNSIWYKSMYLYFDKVYGKKSVKYVYFFTQFWNIVFFTFKKKYKINYKAAMIEFKNWKETKN